MTAPTRAERWPRFLQDMRDYASLPQPLEMQGTLVRVTGLVLEAAGVRAPVGAVCAVGLPGAPSVTAEVVGFNGDRAYLMPTGEVQGLASGARVVPLPIAQPDPAALRGREPPWRRRTEDRGLHLPMGDGLLGRVVDAHGKPMDRGGPMHGTCTTSRWCAARSTRWTATRSASRWTRGCVPSMRC
jgi:flagellum-specific ATP synthase